MWNQWRTDSYEGMTSEMVTIKGYQGDEVHAYFARPNGAGTYPGIVLVHHLPGWDEFYRETARRFAEHGNVGSVLTCTNGSGMAHPRTWRRRREGRVE